MVSKEEFEKMPMGQALIDLGHEMKAKNMDPVDIYVVGGFAMMMHGTRSPDCMTDIDYVGSDLPDAFTRMSDRIGLKHNLGKNWINNELMLTNSSMDEFELSIGKLHFDQTYTVDDIHLHILNEEDLLRMKVIALDTTLSGVQSGEEFTRQRDFADITAMMEKQGKTCDDIASEFKDYIINPEIIPFLKEYQEDGLERVEKSLAQYQKKYMDTLWSTRQGDRKLGQSEYISNMLDGLFQKLSKKAGGSVEDEEEFK